MSTYTVILFLHVCGAFGVFIANGIWLFGLTSLRRLRRVEQVCTVTGLIGRVTPVFGISMITILVAGIYLAVRAWGFQTRWIDVALVSFFLIGALNGFTVPRFRAIAGEAAKIADGPLPEALKIRIHDPVLATALQVQTAMLLGIVFLMTNKPSLTGSLIVMAISLVLGLASGLFNFARAKSADMVMQVTTGSSRLTDK